MPTPRTALVLGAAGSLGSRVTLALLARTRPVVGLVRGVRPGSPLVTDRLFDRIHVVRGDATDGERLRALLAVHEIGAVFQCAAAGVTPGLLAAVADAAPAAVVAVPVGAETPRFRAGATGPRVAFVRFPTADALIDAADVVAAMEAIPPYGLWVTPPAGRAAA